MSQRLIFADSVRPAFAEKVRLMATRLQTDPDFLMAVMAFESAGTFSASVRNPVSGATGLIQFMPGTARGLGTSVTALASMTEEEQLHYVEQYFQPYVGLLGTLEDVYMAVLWPTAVGRPNDYILFDERDGAVYRQNRGLDYDGDGAITKKEATAGVRRRYWTGVDERDD